MFHVFKKELQSFFYSPLMYVISAVFMLIFSINFVYGITAMEGSTFQFSFPTIFYNYFFYFVFLIPTLTMRTFAEERKGGTEVLLMSSPLSLGSIVIGKFLAVSAVYAFMLVLTLIFPIIAAIMGNVVWSGLFCGYIGFFLWGLCCIAIGMLMSSFTENQVIAVVLGEAAMLALLFTDSFGSNEVLAGIPVISSIMTAISAQERFLSFSKGMISLGDLVFYLTFIAAALAFIVISLDKRRRSRG